MSKPNHDYLGRRDASCGCCCVVDIVGLEHLLAPSDGRDVRRLNAEVLGERARATVILDRLAALVAEVEKVGHRGTCRIQPCDCWWAHGLYDAINAAVEFMESSLATLASSEETR